nr:hypothetical protein [uncultured Shinella sp.]
MFYEYRRGLSSHGKRKALIELIDEIVMPKPARVRLCPDDLVQAMIRLVQRRFLSTVEEIGDAETIHEGQKSRLRRTAARSMTSPDMALYNAALEPLEAVLL